MASIHSSSMWSSSGDRYPSPFSSPATLMMTSTKLISSASTSKPAFCMMAQSSSLLMRPSPSVSAAANSAAERRPSPSVSSCFHTVLHTWSAKCAISVAYTGHSAFCSRSLAVKWSVNGLLGPSSTSQRDTAALKVFSRSIGSPATLMILPSSSSSMPSSCCMKPGFGWPCVAAKPSWSSRPVMGTTTASNCSWISLFKSSSEKNASSS
mmetsp:Transcript_14787/g.58007  ORF Transcript_14787/g.58007 Transcript_14787/m.58007 type:complete len:209 (+) Transcript_14787:79-705(+)